MKLLSGIVAATLSSVVALASANAADMYVPGAAGPGGYKDIPYVGVNWSGFYAGVNGGYAWSDQDRYDFFDNSNTIAGSKTGVSPEGGFGGGQIGYNWQGIWHPHLVLGVEADFQGAGITDSALATDTFTYSSKLDWFGTVRGRVGYAIDRALVYFTGGFAYGGVDNSAYNSVSVLRKDDTATGYVLGGGVEYQITPAWSVKAEYKYIDLEKNEPFGVSGAVVGHPLSYYGISTSDDTYHTVSAGVNYHIGNVYEPLK